MNYGGALDKKWHSGYGNKNSSLWSWHTLVLHIFLPLLSSFFSPINNLNINQPCIWQRILYRSYKPCTSSNPCCKISSLIYLLIFTSIIHFLSFKYFFFSYLYLAKLLILLFKPLKRVFGISISNMNRKQTREERRADRREKKSKH